jgi:hypothetical protein
MSKVGGYKGWSKGLFATCYFLEPWEVAENFGKYMNTATIFLHTGEEVKKSKL